MRLPEPRDLDMVNRTCTTPEKMALTLLDFLFDRQVQATSNISGTGRHGKHQLDPLRIFGIRCESGAVYLPQRALLANAWSLPYGGHYTLESSHLNGSHCYVFGECCIRTVFRLAGYNFALRAICSCWRFSGGSSDSRSELRG